MKVSEYLKEHGISQVKFMAKFSISVGTMDSIVKNRYNPRISFVEEVRKYTNGEVAYKDWLIPLDQMKKDRRVKISDNNFEGGSKRCD
jgi:hypothetical protein